MNKHVKTTIVAAGLLAVAALAGCSSRKYHTAGMNWIDRLMTPHMLQPEPETDEYIVPQNGPTLPQIPPPAPPSAFLAPPPPPLPELPGDSLIEETRRSPSLPRDFGFTPVPGQ